jgi:hypothetical protein
MSMVTKENLDDVFTYHAPTAGDLISYGRLRAAARDFAEVVLAETPPCADQQAAIRKVREAVMTANAAVALGGQV